MRIINKTRGTVLSEKALLVDTFPRRIKGLLGKKGLLAGEALILKPCNSIHTFFMRFPIDCLFVDKNNKIIKAIPQLQPFRFCRPYLSSRLVIELPCGTIAFTSTQEGDTIRVVSSAESGHRPIL